MTSTRYAVYYTPAHSSEWSVFGARWLGGDPRTPQRPPAGVPAERFRALTAEPRRYGFHATLKAPFRLRRDATLQSLLGATDRLAASQRPVRLTPLRVQWLGGFLALTPAEEPLRLQTLGAACVTRLDDLRAPLSEDERERRLRSRLDERERELLERWGYPHVLDRWRFHMTLTDVVDRSDTSVRAALAAAAWARLPEEPAAIDALSILVEQEPGAPFTLVERLPLRARGRLIYLMGPSGAGKDSLLAWASARVPSGARIRIACRTISRPEASAAEDAEVAQSVTREQWERMNVEGAFSLAWTANGCAYGIGRELDADLNAGFSVVINGSREYLPEALRRFPALEVIHVVASEATIRARLAARARESATQIEARLDRRIAPRVPSHVTFTEIRNDGPIEAAGSQLLAILLDD